MSRIIAAAALLLGGCSQSFDGIAFMGGSAEEHVSGDIVRVAVAASGLPDRAAVEDATLYQAARATKRKGGTHFVVISGADVQPIGPLASLSGGKKNLPYAAYVKVLRLDPMEKPPPGALSVDEVLLFFGRRLERGSQDSL